MKIDLNTIVIAVAIIVGAIILRPPNPNESLKNHLKNENQALKNVINQRNDSITNLYLNIKKSHENEKEIIRHIDTASVEQLDSIWSRFFENID